MADPVDVTFWAVCLTAFFGLLRKSNLVLQSRNSFNPQSHLRRTDFLFYDNVVLVVNRWSKTIQFRERVYLVPLVRIPGSTLCPVSALLRAFTLVPAPLEGPAFMIPKGGKLVPFTYSLFMGRFKASLSAAGLFGNFASHSFRAGGTTLCFRGGLPEIMIQRMGDWRSLAYKRYIELPLTSRLACMQHMISAL